jgi:hypothetical protein
MAGLVANPLPKVLSKMQALLPLDFFDQPAVWQ